METAKRYAITAQHENIRTTLNLMGIIPFFNQTNMLTDDETYRLKNTNYPEGERIDLLIQILPSKGYNWWDNFLWCLNESSTRPGLAAHGDLANQLVEDLRKQQEVSCELLATMYAATYVIQIKLSNMLLQHTHIHTHNSLHFYSTQVRRFHPMRYNVVRFLQFISGKIHKDMHGVILMVLLLLLVIHSYKGAHSDSTVIVNIPWEAVESRPPTSTHNKANSEKVNGNFTNITPLTNLPQRPLPTHSAASNINVTEKHSTYRNLSLNPSPLDDNKKFSQHHQLPYKNELVLNISDYINILVDLFHIKPDDDLDSMIVMKKQLNLTTNCLLYQIENEKMMHALFDLYKVYLALHTIWFPTSFERYLIGIIESFTLWNPKNLIFYNYIKYSLANATMELLVMKAILGVTNVTQMNMIHKDFKVTDKVMIEQLMYSSKVRETVVSIQQTINLQMPVYYRGSDYHSKLIYYPAVERYLSTVIANMNARDVCTRVCASL